MDESRFLVQNLLRRLPPMPQQAPPVLRELLLQADNFLSLRQPQLALEAMALITSQVAVPPAERAGRAYLDLELALYLSDCYSAVLSHLDLPTHPPPGRAASPRAGCACLVITNESGRFGSIALAMKTVLQSQGWQVTAAVSDDLAPRDPVPKVWKPLAPVPAPGNSPENVPRNSPGANAIAVDFRVPRQGTLLTAGHLLASWVASQSPAMTFFIGGLCAPISVTAMALRTAPVQAAVTDFDPCVSRGADALITVGGPFPGAARRLTPRGMACQDWSFMVREPASPVASVMLDQYLRRLTKPHEEVA